MELDDIKNFGETRVLSGPDRPHFGRLSADIDRKPTFEISEIWHFFSILEEFQRLFFSKQEHFNRQKEEKKQEISAAKRLWNKKKLGKTSIKKDCFGRFDESFEISVDSACLFLSKPGVCFFFFSIFNVWPKRKFAAIYTCFFLW